MRLFSNSSDSGGLSGSELVRLVSENPRGIILVDVRTPDEYRLGHIPTAKNISHERIFDDPPTDDKDARIILYCRSGNRSEFARNVLVSMGYRNVTNFGGVGDWPGKLVRD
ncbi:MAG: rhodanese-like domain-containing protein [Spirochaetota bacterium]